MVSLLAVFLHDEKSQPKILNILKNEKSFKGEIKKLFLSFLKCLQLPEKVSHPRVDHYVFSQLVIIKRGANDATKSDATKSDSFSHCFLCYMLHATSSNMFVIN